MPRKVKVLPGPSRLSGIMANLTRAPRPHLVGLKTLKLTLAAKNDHFGARHFLKDDMPRIRYANPKLNIEVNKKPKTKEETWKPELVLEYNDGRTKTIDLHEQWSTDIFQRVMDAAGGTSWTRWKTEREAAGLPLLDAPTPRARAQPQPPTPNKQKSGAAAVLP
ncbi:hypothetical protein OF83DRAFT_1118924 [Amylostereum chailletii]|nr:hypothetical protein OF83DRAFT_1118924 [Amylostereum chailletii]